MQLNQSHGLKRRSDKIEPHPCSLGNLLRKIFGVGGLGLLWNPKHTEHVTGQNSSPCAVQCVVDGNGFYTLLHVSNFTEGLCPNLRASGSLAGHVNFASCALFFYLWGTQLIRLMSANSICRPFHRSVPIIV